MTKTCTNTGITKPECCCRACTIEMLWQYARTAISWCKGCMEPVANGTRWCSDDCFIMEDLGGYEYAEEAYA